MLAAKGVTKESLQRAGGATYRHLDDVLNACMGEMITSQN